MTTTTEARIAIALEALELGFTSKAAKKRANEELSRAYSSLRDAARKRLIARAPGQNLGRDLTAAEWQARREFFAAHDNAPLELHNVRDRHLAEFGDDAGTVEQLVEIRNLVKAAPIVPVEREENTRELEIRDSIRDLMQKRKAQYDRALDLADMFGGLPVQANVHLVTNAHGTTFVRAFYYLRGEFTPLNVILAAAEELARRED